LSRTFQLKISLPGYPPWRRVWVDENTTLAQLDEIIRVVFNWPGKQEYYFEIKGKTISPPVYGPVFMLSLDGKPPPDTTIIRLAHLWNQNIRNFQYFYDWLTGFWHTVEMEKVFPTPPTERLPLCMEGDYKNVLTEIDPGEFYDKYLLCYYSSGCDDSTKPTDLIPVTFTQGSFDLKAANDALKRLLGKPKTATIKSLAEPLILTPRECRLLQGFFLAVFFNDLDKVRRFRDKYPRLYALKDNFPLSEKHTIDLRDLTRFHHIIWFDNEWRDEIRPFVEKMRRRTRAMMTYWQEEDPAFPPAEHFPYNRFHEYFYCADPEDREEVFGESFDYYRRLGLPEKDILLFYYGERFDFEQVERLIQEGANPHAPLEPDEWDSTLYDRIESEWLFLISVELIPVIKEFEKEGYRSWDIKRLFGILIGAAAHQEMINLLDRLAPPTKS